MKLLESYDRHASIVAFDREENKNDESAANANEWILDWDNINQ